MVKLPNSSVQINHNDRVFIGGQTGSGKTVLASVMLHKVKRLLVVDSKDSLAKWGLPLFDQYTKDKIRLGEDFRVRVVDDNQAIDLLESVYKYGNCFIYIDEVNAIIPPRKNPPQVFNNIWQRGRERGIGAWASSQRPVSIPLIFVSEAQHIFVFRLTNEADRKTVYGYVGNKKILEPIRNRYGFYYYDVLENRLRYIQQLQI